MGLVGYYESNDTPFLHYGNNEVWNLRGILVIFWVCHYPPFFVAALCIITLLL